MEPSHIGPTIKPVSGTINKSEQNSVPDKSRLPPRSRSHSKRRLAATRGFQNFSPSRGGSYLVTPNNSSLASFRPTIKSTPAGDQGYCPNLNIVQLPDHPPISPGVIQFNSSIQPTVRQPLQGIETSVISPRLSIQEQSLDWDNYDTQPAPDHLFGDIHGISGLEDIRKVTLVETSISSFSSGNMSLHQGLNSEASANAQLRVIKNMVEVVEEMMEDFSPDDVRKGNLAEVPKLLDEISKARTEFRNSVREYKQLYNPSASDIGFMDNAVKALNQSVRSHAHSVWAKVEEVQGHSSQTSTATSGKADRGSQLQDDMEFKRNLYRDQLLYLRESLNLPDSDDAIGIHWKNKTESEVAAAMHEISTWQKSIERLSKSFREYERIAQLSGHQSDSTFISDNEDFEEIRNKVKEVIIAVRDEDHTRNLQSLLPAKSEKVKYPIFTGESGEDFMRFKEKMIECFRKNRVPQSDMVDKL